MTKSENLTTPERQSSIARQEDLCLDRRRFLKLSGLSLLAASGCVPEKGAAPTNIILAMSDDQGWGDVGYNGHPFLKTPHLDAMAASGLRFDRFYASAPVCSPTRGSCLTGRHAYRYGVYGSNKGHLPDQELTIAELLKPHGYRTGHFGKWHLGTLTREMAESNRGGQDSSEHYSPPWENGFDFSFSTEAKVPTWDPMRVPERRTIGVGPDQVAGEPYGTAYWLGPGQRAEDNLEGDDSRVMMDRVIPFIEETLDRGQPFLAVIWFHTPHSPVVAGEDYLAQYTSCCSEAEQHYYGSLTAMDEQIGRLRGELVRLGVAADTCFFFCSDNGPAGRQREGDNQGSAGPFRGRKSSLFEGGIRVPAILEWPARVQTPRVVDVPACTLDYFPTVAHLLGHEPRGPIQPLDGLSLLPLIDGEMEQRPAPIAFQHGRRRLAVIDNRYKILSLDNGETWALFDLINDPGETKDLSALEPQVVLEMRLTFDAWRASYGRSLAGEDYLT